MMNKKDILKQGVSLTMGLGAGTLVKTVASTLVPAEVSIPTKILCGLGTRAIGNLASSAAYKHTLDTCNTIDYTIQYIKNEISVEESAD